MPPAFPSKGTGAASASRDDAPPLCGTGAGLQEAPRSGYLYDAGTDGGVVPPKEDSAHLSSSALGPIARIAIAKRVAATLKARAVGTRGTPAASAFLKHREGGSAWVRLAAADRSRELEAGRRGGGLAEEQITLVQASWVPVSRDLEHHGRVFFDRVFEVAPEALQLFSFRGETNYQESRGFKSHALTVMATVGKAVAGLNDLGPLAGVLRDLGARHGSYGVVPEHFPVVAGALVYTLEKGLGDMLTAKVRNAWLSALGVVEAEMLAGIREWQAAGSKRALSPSPRGKKYKDTDFFPEKPKANLRSRILESAYGEFDQLFPMFRRKRAIEVWMARVRIASLIYMACRRGLKAARARIASRKKRAAQERLEAFWLRAEMRHAAAEAEEKRAEPAPKAGERWGMLRREYVDTGLSKRVAALIQELSSVSGQREVAALQTEIGDILRRITAEVGDLASVVGGITETTTRYIAEGIEWKRKAAVIIAKLAAEANIETETGGEAEAEAEAEAEVEVEVEAETEAEADAESEAEAEVEVEVEVEVEAEIEAEAEAEVLAVLQPRLRRCPNMKVQRSGGGGGGAECDSSDSGEAEHGEHEEHEESVAAAGGGGGGMVSVIADEAAAHLEGVSWGLTFAALPERGSGRKSLRSPPPPRLPSPSFVRRSSGALDIGVLPAPPAPAAQIGADDDADTNSDADADSAASGDSGAGEGECVAFPQLPEAGEQSEDKDEDEVPSPREYETCDDGDDGEGVTEDGEGVTEGVTEGRAGPSLPYSPPSRQGPRAARGPSEGGSNRTTPARVPPHDDAGKSRKTSQSRSRAEPSPGRESCAQPPSHAKRGAGGKGMQGRRGRSMRSDTSREAGSTTPRRNRAPSTPRPPRGAPTPPGPGAGPSPARGRHSIPARQVVFEVAVQPGASPSSSPPRRAPVEAASPRAIPSPPTTPLRGWEQGIAGGPPSPRAVWRSSSGSSSVRSWEASTPPGSPGSPSSPASRAAQRPRGPEAPRLPPVTPRKRGRVCFGKGGDGGGGGLRSSSSLPSLSHKSHHHHQQQHHHVTPKVEEPAGRWETDGYFPRLAAPSDREAGTARGSPRRVLAPRQAHVLTSGINEVESSRDRGAKLVMSSLKRRGVLGSSGSAGSSVYTRRGGRPATQVLRPGVSVDTGMCRLAGPDAGTLLVLTW